MTNKALDKTIYCPYCGNEDNHYVGPATATSFHVQCRACGAPGPTIDLPDDIKKAIPKDERKHIKTFEDVAHWCMQQAIRAWNRRHTPPAPVPPRRWYIVRHEIRDLPAQTADALIIGVHAISPADAIQQVHEARPHPFALNTLHSMQSWEKVTERGFPIHSIDTLLYRDADVPAQVAGGKPSHS